MIELPSKQYAWQRALQHIPASRLGARFFAKFLHIVDPPVMRWSNGRICLPTLLIGVPVVLLTSTGARSGQRRIMPIIGIPDSHNFILIASNWGQKRNPGWYYNLRANPTATIEFGGHRASYEAQMITEPAAYNRLWRKANAVYRGFDSYQQRAVDRQIPIILMRPQTGSQQK